MMMNLFFMLALVGAYVFFLTVHVYDNDTPFVLISDAAVTVVEGSLNASYWIELGSQPTADVTISIDNSASNGLVIASAVEITFTPSDWNVAQPIVLSGPNDDISNSDFTYNLVHSSASSDTNYDSGVMFLTSTSVNVKYYDDDIASIHVSKTQISLSEQTPTSATYQVSLTSQPTAAVTISIDNAGAGSRVSADFATLDFTTDNWHEPQTVTLTVNSDDVVNSDLSYDLVHTATSSDPMYDGLSAFFLPSANVHVQLQDNDYGSVMISKGSFYLLEGESSTYDISLTSSPNSTVVVNLSPSARISVSPDSITFTASNWSTPVEITMTTVVDSIAHGLPDVKSIVHSLVTSDPVYSTAPFLPAASIPVELHDIGMPGVSISPLRLFLTELEVATYEVVLFSQPLDTVVISIIDPEAQNFVTLDKDTLTFETGDWDTPQVVTATALDTFVANGVEPLKFTFVHTSSSTDTAYNGAGTYFVPSNGVLNVTLYNKDIECVNPCLPGKYPMLYGDIPICLNCPMGFYCPGECNGPIACPIGTRSDAEKAISKSTCESCPEGYISAYEASTTCTICPSGTICPDPASPWTPCATGSFSSAGSIECTNCTAGYACADPSLAPEICQDGQYSTAGQTECTPCPAGHFCPTASAEPVQCDAGYYSPGLITNCTECPVGSSCMDPAVPPRACSSTMQALARVCRTCPTIC